MAAAKAPSRGDKLTIGWGMISVPVTLFNAVDETAGSIKRKMFSPDGNPIRFKRVDEVTGEEIPNSTIQMMYDHAGDGESYVELTDAEINAALGAPNGESELVGFFPTAEAGKYVVSSNYQVRPQTVKVGSKMSRPYDKAFMLLMTAMDETDSFALVKFTTRGKPKFMGLYPDGSAQVFHFSDEVREQAKMPTVEDAGIKDAERAVAIQLVQQSRYDEAPLPFENDALAKVAAYAEAKAAGKTPEAAKPVEASSDDLMALLTASLAGAAA
jgi:DNA end-binding protein Ku